MSISPTLRSYSYSVFEFILDEMKGTSIPVGVALWGCERDAIWIRFAAERERVKGLRAKDYFHIDGVSKEIQRWIQSGNLPYARSEMMPNSDAWWSHLSKLLVHQIRCSPPKPIDCFKPSAEIDSLYEAVVGPRHPSKERTQRIDRAISQSLGSVALRLNRGCVNGYAGREIAVHRFKSGSDKMLVVEGVNLASVNAELEVDALVSRFQRIIAGNSKGDDPMAVRFCVGYLASPHGLNGEAALVDWIKEAVNAKTFDLVREASQFASEVDLELSDIEPQVRMPA